MAPEPLRTPALRLLSATLFLIALTTPAHALRFIAYNILNYPGSTGATRDPSYRVTGPRPRWPLPRARIWRAGARGSRKPRVRS